MRRKDKEEHPAQIWCVRSLPRRPSPRLLPDSSFICLFFCRCVYTCECMCTDVWGHAWRHLSHECKGEPPVWIHSAANWRKISCQQKVPLSMAVYLVLRVSALVSTQVPWQGEKAFLGEILLLDLFRHIMKPLCNTFPQATRTRSTQIAAKGVLTLCWLLSLYHLFPFVGMNY